jgi:hypothetical protein
MSTSPMSYMMYNSPQKTVDVLEMLRSTIKSPVRNTNLLHDMESDGLMDIIPSNASHDSNTNTMNYDSPLAKKRSSLSVATSKGDKDSLFPSPATTKPTPLPSRVVKVAIRVRPFSQTELQSDARRVVSHNQDRLVLVNPTAFDADPDTIALAAATVQCKEWAQVFRFDHILW